MKVPIWVSHSAWNLCTSVSDVTVSASSEHALIFIVQIMSWWLLPETDISTILEAWMKVYSLTSWMDPWFSLICHNIFSTVCLLILLLNNKHHYDSAQSNICLSAKWNSGRFINILIFCTSAWKVYTWNFIFRILGLSITFILFCLANKLFEIITPSPIMSDILILDYSSIFKYRILSRLLSHICFIM